MKKLQNNFTTPEQSKRLLELGIPANSADCYIHISECIIHEEIYKKCEYGIIEGSGIFGNEIPALLRLPDGSPEYLPCWSVGRLMEIYDICVIEGAGSWANYTARLNYMNYLVACFETSKFDFSKLED